MSLSVSPPTVPFSQFPFVWLLRSYQQAIATIRQQEGYLQSLETTMQQNLSKYHEAMGQYHELRQQFDHQYSTQYQQYFALPIPCYRWQWLDGQLQLIDFNPAAARFSGDRLQQPTMALGYQPERLFAALPALQRSLLESYSAKTSRTYHLEFAHLQLYLKVNYVYLEPDQLSMFVADETEQVLREQQLRQKAKQQSAIARLGQLGLEIESGTPDQWERLLRQAVTSVARMLGLPFACIYQGQSASQPYRLAATYGWAAELVGQVTLNGDLSRSHGGYVLKTKDTVVIENVVTETRFQPESLLTDYGIVSGVGILIGTAEQAWGVLAVYSTEPYEFSSDQINFVKAIANILATVQHRIQQTHHLNLLHRSINAIDQGVLIKDYQQPQQPIIYGNRGFQEMSGYSETEILHQNGNFLQGADTNRQALQALKTAIAQGEACERLVRHYRKSGESFLDELQIFPVWDQQQQLTHFVEIHKDVTAQHRIAQDLQRSHCQFQHLFDLAPIGMAIANLQGHYQSVNRAWCKTLGYDAATLCNLSDVEVTHPEDLAEDLRLNQLLHQGKIKQFKREKRYLTQAHQVVKVLMQAVLVETTDGQPLQVIRQMVTLS